MGGARALIASVGASISLVAGAALSLLVVSFIFAYDGLTNAIDEPASHTAFVLESAPASPARAARTREAAPVVIRATAPPAPVVARRRAASGARTGGGVTQSEPAFTPGVAELPPSTPTPATTAPAAPTAATGDGVREVGDAVSGTVDGAGGAAGEATAPLLGPPVTQAVQEVLDLLTSILQGATGGLAGTLDKTLPQ